MDWFSWLSKSRLQSPFIHEYALAFSRNQLEEDDISYFNHEFLQSMGISIGKHRLEILELARKSSGSNSMAKLIATIKKTKRALARYVRTWVHRNDSAMVSVKRRTYSSRWKAVTMKRSNRLVMNKQAAGCATFLITNGNEVVGCGGAKVNSLSDSLDNDIRHVESKEDGDEYKGSDDDEEGGGYWSGRGIEKIKWDAMFQNLKPT